MLKTKHILLACFISFGATEFAVASTQQTMVEAVKGDATAQYALGKLYLYGHGGFPKDSTKAANWLFKSAQQNNPTALVAMGEMLLRGEGIDQNVERGLAFIEKSAQLNHSHALVTLAKIYDKGEFVQYNPVKTVELLERAADQGDFASKGLLGHYLISGETKDIPKAIKYLTMAAQHGDSSAQTTLGSLYLNSGEFEANPSKALIWLERAAKQNNTEALFQLAKMYENSIGVKMDFDKAKKLYGLAANKGHSEALSAYKRIVKKEMKMYK